MTKSGERVILGRKNFLRRVYVFDKRRSADIRLLTFKAGVINILTAFRPPEHHKVHYEVVMFFIFFHNSVVTDRAADRTHRVAIGRFFAAARHRRGFEKAYVEFLGVHTSVGEYVLISIEEIGGVIYQSGFARPEMVRSLIVVIRNERALHVRRNNFLQVFKHRFVFRVVWPRFVFHKHFIETQRVYRVFGRRIIVFIGRIVTPVRIDIGIVTIIARNGVAIFHDTSVILVGIYIEKPTHRARRVSRAAERNRFFRGGFFFYLLTKRYQLVPRCGNFIRTVGVDKPRLPPQIFIVEEETLACGIIQRIYAGPVERQRIRLFFESVFPDFVVRIRIFLDQIRTVIHHFRG